MPSTSPLCAVSETPATPRRTVAHLKDGRALARGRRLGIEHIELAPGHALDRLLLTQRGGVVGTDGFAIAVDRDPIGDAL